MVKDEMTLSEYVELINSGNYFPLSAHERMYKAIQHAIREGIITSEVDQTLLNRLIEQYFYPASLGYDIHKRMLILVGPPGSGKSSVVRWLKQAMESFSYTDQGAIYEIKGCPMQEDPLLALPKHVRQELPIKVNGELSPFNQFRLKNEWDNNWQQIPVKRFYISETNRKGIGTFFPGDPYSQDISDLIGSVDFSTISTYGSSSDPRAYRYDGEFQAANRGMLELQEVFKANQQLLYPFLSLAEEKVYKISRQSLVTADEVVIGHTNEEDLKEFIKIDKHQAILNRMVIVKVPYNLKLSQEVTMYQNQLLENDKERLGFYALETLAGALILTRMKRSSFSITLLEKLEQYNTNRVDQAIIKEFPGEGMEGLDPRYAFHVLSVICAKRLTIIDANDLLAQLEELIKGDYRISSGKKEQYIYAIQLARKFYTNAWLQLIKDIVVEVERNELEKLMTKYLTSQPNSLHNRLGIDQSNFKHFESVWQSLIDSSEHIMFNELPESFQSALIDLHILNQQERLAEWFNQKVKPQLNSRGVKLTEKAETDVKDLLNQYLYQLN